jgi:glycosyltransferase involved in cell wall biosynthesis
VLYLRSDLWRGLRAGGSVGHVLGMAVAFQREGQRVSFLAAEVPAGVDREVMPVHEVAPPPLLRVRRAAARFEHSFQLLREGARILGAEPPGFIYHRFDEGSLAGVLLARRLEVPLVLEYNGSGVWIAQNWGRPLPHRRTFLAIEKANLRHAHLVVTVSDVLRDQLLAQGVEAHRILVCPNGVDPGVYRPDRDGAGVRARLDLEGRTVVGFIGTFGPWHGARVLARAARAVLARNPGAAFLFLGDGPEREKTQALLREEGIGQRCRFTGTIPQEEAPDYLAACDVFASPHVPNPDGTRFFGSPTKLFEYMATGRGIVASRLEQIGQILEHEKTALLVPPGDADALAIALERLIQDAPLAARLGAAARRQAVAQHSWEANARAVLDLVRFI